MYLKKRGKKANEEKREEKFPSRPEGPNTPASPTEAGNGKYEILEIIGKGGFGKVYKCLCRETGAIYALKRINVKGCNKAESEAFEQEIQLLNTLSHPNIVKYIDSAQTGDFLDIIMDYVEGGQVSSILKKFQSGPPEGLIARYMSQVLKGLSYLHQQGVVHRDIKGANILSNKAGVIKLADFGVAAKLTSSGQQMHDAIGTPYWMAPEIIEMKSQMSPACDIWSLGCTILELLTGSPPWQDLPPMSAMYHIVNDDHPPLPEGISPFLESFLMECFQKDPIRRVSAGALLKHPWLNSFPGAIAPEESVRRSTAAQRQRSTRYLSSGTPPALLGPTLAPTPLIHKFSEEHEKENLEDLDGDLVNMKTVGSPQGLHLFWVDQAQDSGSDTDPFDAFEEPDEVDERLATLTQEERLFEQSMGALFPDEDESVIVEACAVLSELLSKSPGPIRKRLLSHGLMPWLDLLETDSSVIVLTVLALLNLVLMPQREAARTVDSAPPPPPQPPPKGKSAASALPKSEDKDDEESALLTCVTLLSMGLAQGVAKFVSPEYVVSIRVEAAIMLKQLCFVNPPAFLACGGLRWLSQMLNDSHEGIMQQGIDCLLHVFEVAVNKNDLCRLCCKLSVLPSLIKCMAVLCGVPGAAGMARVTPFTPQNTMVVEAFQLPRNGPQYLGKLGTLVFFFAASTPIVKAHFVKPGVMAGLLAVMPLLPDKKPVLRTFRSVVTEPAILTSLVVANALPAGLMAQLIECLQSGDRDIKSEALRCIYCLSSATPELQLSAARGGVILHLASFLWTSDHLSAFALPILFHIARPTPETSKEMFATGALDLLFALLRHPYHRMPALNCIAQWVKMDLSMESVLLNPKNLENLSRAVRETKIPMHVEKLLESLNALVVVSDDLTLALAQDLALRDDLLARLRGNSSNAIRILLIKMLGPLIQMAPNPNQFIEECQLLPLLATLSKDQSSSIVQKLGSLMFDYCTGVAKVSSERRRTLVAEAQPIATRPSKRIPTAAAWKLDESSSDCSVCHKKFSVFTRRHHCRNCGSLACSKCSSQKREQLGEMVRICDLCCSRLDRAKFEARVWSSTASCISPPTPSSARSLPPPPPMPVSPLPALPRRSKPD